MIEIKDKKAQLQKELKVITELEHKQTIEKYYPIIKKEYEGKYFKRPNGYNDKERWVMYTKVTEITPDDIYDTGGNGVTAHYKGFEFQVCSDKKILVEEVTYGYVHSLGKEITESEFNAAWNKMIDAIDKYNLK